MEENWIGPVCVDVAIDYVKSKFPDAQDIKVLSRKELYLVTFYDAANNDDLEIVQLTPFLTNIQGQEIDEEWIKIVRQCNEYREVEGVTYDDRLVDVLENYILSKLQNKINEAEREYKQDQELLDKIYKGLGIEVGSEPNC